VRSLNVGRLSRDNVRSQCSLPYVQALIARERRKLRAPGRTPMCRGELHSTGPDCQDRLGPVSCRTGSTSMGTLGRQQGIR
jgi:hypothetical protein